MNVLIVSANQFNFSPSGPAYIAGAARDAGHKVEVFDCLFAGDIQSELAACLDRFRPDVVGISIRTVTGLYLAGAGEFNMQPFDSRVLVRNIVDCIKAHSSAHIVPGGPGFNYYGPDWLDYLGLDYGLRGEADFSFPEYLRRLETGEDVRTIPGCVYRDGGGFVKQPRERIMDLDKTSFPAYDLFDLPRYIEKKIAAGISTRRGCGFHCYYCPYSSLEGARYRLKSASRVVDEMEHILRINRSLTIEFCDNCFNFPLKPTVAVCEEIIRRSSNIRWSTIDLKPLGVTREFLDLLKTSGCASISLSADSASDKLLLSLHRGYTGRQVEESLSRLAESGIPFGVSLLMGGPGETPETIEETLAVIDRYPVPRLSVTIGINLWTHHQPMVKQMLETGELSSNINLFDEAHYISPELPREFMLDLIKDLNTRQNCSVFVFKPYAGYKWPREYRITQ